jgi:hypothetical protein
MSVKIVTCDLAKPKYYYKDFIHAINTYKNVKITESFWFISTEENCEDVFRNLEIFLDKTDRLLIQDLNENEITGMNLLSTESELQSLFK